MTQDEEANITPTRRLSHSSTLRERSSREADLHTEQADKSSRLALSETEALAYARTQPKEQLPIYLTLAPNDLAQMAQMVHHRLREHAERAYLLVRRLNLIRSISNPEGIQRVC